MALAGGGQGGMSKLLLGFTDAGCAGAGFVVIVLVVLFAVEDGG